MLNGYLNIYKEASFTSHDVVAKLRGITRQKKIGHFGTLDPEATGVLPVCLGQGTKALSLLPETDKTYRAKLCLGLVTDTQDLTGTVLEKAPDELVGLLTEGVVEEAILSFLGDSLQIPPMYSAKKVNGKKLYEYAREGITIEREPCPVHIDEIVVDEMALPEVTFIVSCSSGTYIRTLCHDIGQKLGVGGAMKSLERIKAGVFTANNAYRLEEVQQRKNEGTLEEIVLPVDFVFSDFPKVICKPAFDKPLFNGAALEREALIMTDSSEEETLLSEQSYRMYHEDGRFIGIYYFQDGKMRPKRLMME